MRWLWWVPVARRGVLAARVWLRVVSVGVSSSWWAVWRPGPPSARPVTLRQGGAEPSSHPGVNTNTRAHVTSRTDGVCSAPARAVPLCVAHGLSISCCLFALRAADPALSAAAHLIKIPDLTDRIWRPSSRGRGVAVALRRLGHVRITPTAVG